jgi:four helix bundle protein
MNIAQASLEELRYYFLLTSDLEYADAKTEDGAEEIGRMLNTYITPVTGSRSLNR